MPSLRPLCLALSVVLLAACGAETGDGVDLADPADPGVPTAASTPSTQPMAGVPDPTAPPTDGTVPASCDGVRGTRPVDSGDTITPDMARTTQSDAAAVAAAAVGGTVTSIELDGEDGYLVYQADVSAGDAEYEVLVDPETGEVLCADRD